MKKLVLSTIITAAGAGIMYAAKQGALKPAIGKVKPALDRAMQVPIIAKAVDTVNNLRQPAENDDPMMDDQAKAA